MYILDLPNEILLHIFSCHDVLQPPDLLHLASTCRSLSDLALACLYQSIDCDLNLPRTSPQGLQQLDSLIFSVIQHPERGSWVRSASLRWCENEISEVRPKISQFLEKLPSLHSLAIKIVIRESAPIWIHEQHNMIGMVKRDIIRIVKGVRPLRDQTPSRLLYRSLNSSEFRMLTIEDPAMAITDVMQLYALPGIEYLKVCRFNIEESKAHGKIRQPASSLVELEFWLSSPPSALLANNLLPCHPRLKKLTWVVNHALLDQRSLSPLAISMAFVPFRALFVELTLSITPCSESGANDDGSQLNVKDFTSLRILKVHDRLLRTMYHYNPYVDGVRGGQHRLPSFVPVWQRLPLTLESLTVSKNASQFMVAVLNVLGAL
jgi:hypothetical protein